MSEWSEELTAALVAGFGAAMTHSNDTANWFTCTATAGLGPCQAHRRDVEGCVGRLWLADDGLERFRARHA